MKQIAYLGWLGAGNLGDEGCYQLFQRSVRAISNRITCVPLTIAESQGRLYAYRPGAGSRAREAWRPAAYDYVVLGGGSLLNADRYVRALHAAQAAGVPTAVWGTGFDGLPHRLAKELMAGKGSSGRVRPLCESAPGHVAPEPPPVPHPSTPEVLRALRAGGVRGPLSAAWLEANGCTSVRVAGDPGLLLPSGFSMHRLGPGDGLDPLNPSGTPGKSPAPRTQIAVIWGMSQRATHQGITHSELTRRVARWLKALSGRSIAGVDGTGGAGGPGAYRPVICAMWSHDVPAARELALAVGEGATLLEPPLTLESFTRLMSRSAFTLSYRLHGCIFSAACGTPFCSIAYRSKCYDFALSIGAGEWVIDPGAGAGNLEERLDRWIARFESRGAESLRDQLARAAARHRKTLAGIVQHIISELEEGA